MTNPVDNASLHIFINAPGNEREGIDYSHLYNLTTFAHLSIISKNIESEFHDSTEIYFLMQSILCGSETAYYTLQKIIPKGFITCINWDGDGITVDKSNPVGILSNLDKSPPPAKIMLSTAIALKMCGIRFIIHDVQYNEWQLSIDKYKETEGCTISLKFGGTKSSDYLITPGFFDDIIFHTSYHKIGCEKFLQYDYGKDTHSIIAKVECNRGAWSNDYSGFDGDEILGSAKGHNATWERVRKNGGKAEFVSIFSWDTILTGRNELGVTSKSTMDGIKNNKIFGNDGKIICIDAGCGWANKIMKEFI